MPGISPVLIKNQDTNQTTWMTDEPHRPDECTDGIADAVGEAPFFEELVLELRNRFDVLLGW